MGTGPGRPLQPAPAARQAKGIQRAGVSYANPGQDGLNLKARTSMDLILWRHAEAEDGPPSGPDAARELTARGRKQAMKMAGWLDRNLPSGCRILCSPARRTVQTADALGRKFRIHADLGIDGQPQRMLQLANWPLAREPVLLVGHQPTLGRLASL